MDTATHYALLNAIFADPDADLPRLVYADFLEENGQAERAEFIRIQCEPGYSPDWSDDKPTRLDAEGRHLQSREQQLHHKLLPSLRVAGWDRVASPDKCVVCYTPEESWPRVTRIDVTFRRGFIDHIRCPFDWWFGKTCETCRGTGFDGNCSEFGCLGCGNSSWIGTGMNGLAAGPSVLLSHPVSHVSISDRRPIEMEGEGRRWFCWTSGVPSHDLPWQLRKDVWMEIECEPQLKSMFRKLIDSMPKAMTALNHAAYRWAKRNGH